MDAEQPFHAPRSSSNARSRRHFADPSRIAFGSGYHLVVLAISGALRVMSWPLGCVGLISVGLALLAVPARFEGPTLLVISAGHALSVVDVVGIVPLIAGASWLHAGLWSRRASLEMWLREQPAAAGVCLFAAGLGLGLLLASAFSAFFWWWAIGALLFGGMHVPLLTAALRQRSGPARTHRESGCGPRR